MNKRSEYNSLEWQIIAGSIMIMIVSVLFLSDSGITGLVARSNVKQITLPENNQTPILIEKPVQIEAPSEQPVQVESTQPPPQIKTQSGCVTPVENLIINESTTLCSGTYYLNDPEGDGAIKIGADNVVLDCNGSQIIGNSVLNSISLYNNKTNIEIKNCKLSNYYVGIRSRLGTNVSINNNEIINILDQGIYVQNSDLTIRNNNFSCTYELLTHRKAISAGGSASNLLIENNSIYGGCDTGIFIFYNFKNVSVRYNLIKNNDRGIRISDSSNIFIYNNTISNNTNNLDAYDLSISLENNLDQNHAENISISDNIFEEVVGGILIQNYKNVNIENNFFDSINISERYKYLANDGGMAPCLTYSVLLYKGYFTINSTATNITHFMNGVSENIIILNNSYDEDTKCFIMNEETINLSHDYPTTKNISFQAPTDLTGKINLILKNNFSQLYTYSNTTLDYMYTSFKGTSTNSRKILYNITENKYIYKNINTTQNYEISLFNLSAPFNDVKNTSNGVILASNVDNYSITLSPNQEIEVGDFVEDPIYNYPPTIANLTLTDNFNCSGTVNDVDSNISINLSFIRNNITYSSTNTSSAIITPELIDLDTWKCNVTVSDETHTVSQVSNDIQVLINDPPSINITLSSPDNSTFYNLSCIINITDPDSSNITTNIAWYKNDILENEENKSGKNIVSIKEPTLNDVFYCTAVSNDTQNTSSAVSNSITIGNHTNIPPVIEVTLSSDLTCQGTVDKQSNITISYYKNSQLQEVFVTENNTFSTSQQSSSGEWYCQIQANDGINTTTTNSNTITISTQSSGGGGGSSSSSSSSYTPITKEVINESINTNFTSNVTKQVNSVEAINNNTPPIIESPLKDTVGKAFEITKNNNSQYIVFILTALILFIIVIKTAKPIQTDQKIIGYTQKALSLGYDYDAIRHVLRKQLSNSVIDHHFHILRLRNIGPNKQYKKPMTYNIQNRTIAITNIRNFIQNQKTNGFKDKHIEKILLQNGYPKELVKEALNTPY